MHLRQLILRASVFVVLLQIPAAMAQSEPEIAIGPLLSSTGVGIEASTPLIPGWLNLNAGITGFGFNYTAHVSNNPLLHLSATVNGTNYNLTIKGSPYYAKANLGSVPVFLSFYPFGNWFNLQAGMVFNNNRISVRRDYLANGYDFGNIVGSTHFHFAAPFIGIGFGQPFAGGRFTFTGNLGVFYEGAPGIKLEPSIPLVDQITPVESQLRAEQHELNNDARWAEIYPVLSLGVEYRF